MTRRCRTSARTALPRAELDRSTLAALEAAEAPGLRELVARAAMQERLGLAVECYDAARADAKDRAKDAFSLKDFHSRALGLGPMGLDPLRQALAQL
jgi:hypothetical protein